MSQNRTRTTRLCFRVSEHEHDLITSKMEQAGIRNKEAYLRKMSIDGYVIKLDLSDIQELIRLLRNVSNNMNQIAKRANETRSIYESLQTKLLGQATADRAKNRQTIRLLEQRLHKLETETATLYEQRIEGTLSDDAFSRLIDGIASEKQEKENRLALCKQAEMETADRLSDIEKWVNLIREKSLIDEVDRELLESLIDKIEVGERSLVDGVKSQDIRVHYKFVGMV